LKDYCQRNGLERDFLIYSSKDGKEKDLEDVDGSWDNKYVFHTPTVQYGVDFNPKKAMCVYAFFQCQSISPLGFGQMTARCRNISHLRYNIRERNYNLTFKNAKEIKDDSSDVLNYFKKLCDTLDSYDEKKYNEEKKIFEEIHKDFMSYAEYNPRNSVKKAEVSSEFFNSMYWQLRYYNAIMQSSMNYHFQNILKEKGYHNIQFNSNIHNYKVDDKKLIEKVKEELHDAVINACGEPEDNLTDKEKKIRSEMKKRAEILNIDLEKGQERVTYIDQMTDNKLFRSHLNLCSIIKVDQDTKFIEASRVDFAVKSITQNALKLKLIDEVQTILNIAPLDVDDITENDYKKIPDDKQTIIKKVFRINDVDIMSMYRHMCPGLVSSKQHGRGKDRYTVHTIDDGVMKYHLNLLSLRNEFMEGINKDTLNYFGYVPPKKPEKKKKK
jgi:hypothetical protein